MKPLKHAQPGNKAPKTPHMPIIWLSRNSLPGPRYGHFRPNLGRFWAPKMVKCQTFPKWGQLMQISEEAGLPGSQARWNRTWLAGPPANACLKHNDHVWHFFQGDRVRVKRNTHGGGGCFDSPWHVGGSQLSPTVVKDRGGGGGIPGFAKCWALHMLDGARCLDFSRPYLNYCPKCLLSPQLLSLSSTWNISPPPNKNTLFPPRYIQNWQECNRLWGYPPHQM